MERKVRLDRRHINFRHEDGLAEAVLALAILVFQQVALALTAAEHFTGTCHLESLGDRFPRFAYTWVLGHRGGDARESGDVSK